MKIIITLLMTIFILSACTNSDGEKFIGSWKDEYGHILNISKEGDHSYVLKNNNRTINIFVYKDGKLKGNTFGDYEISSGSDNDHIYWGTNQMVRIKE